MMSLFAASRRLRRTALLLVACTGGAGANTSDAAAGHGDAPAAAKASAPTPVVVAPPPSPATPDPMDRLRRKLAQKLGAAPVAGGGPGNVVSVSLKPSLAASQAAEPARPATARTRTVAARPPAVPASANAAGAASWSYAGSDGPDAWGTLRPEFATCARGSRQSPIDIRGGIGVELEPIRFDYQPGAARVVDNGHTVEVDVAPGNWIEVGGRRFELVRFDFQRPSEELVDGKPFDMGVHLVHQDSEGRLAIVAVPLERGSAHALVQSIWNDLPLEKGEAQPTRAPLNAAELLPADRRYFTYMGSLTTPPCREGVLWMVMQTPVPVSPAQIDIFARLYPMNARPVQASAGRLIKQSN